MPTPSGWPVCLLHKLVWVAPEPRRHQRGLPAETPGSHLPLFPVLQEECTDREPWYGTKFVAAALPQDWVDDWEAGARVPELHMPEPNPFIPSDFELLSVEHVSARTQQLHASAHAAAAAAAPPPMD